MNIENVISSLRKRSMIGLLGLALSIGIANPSLALMNGSGQIIDEYGTIYSCKYKGHNFTARCEFKGNQRYCYPIRITNQKGENIDLKDLNPLGCLIFLDPNTSTCYDIENSCPDSDYPCC